VGTDRGDHRALLRSESAGSALRALNRLFRRLLNSAARRRGDERLREEIESHLAIQTEENIRAGMTPQEARRQACLKFGAVEAIREDYRAEEGLPFVENLLLDVRYALRVLRKSPGFSGVVVLTLMLAIGANVVVFGVLKAVLLPQQEVIDPDGLYQIRIGPRRSGAMLTTSYPAFEDFRQRNRTFSGMAGFYGYSGGTLSWRNAGVAVKGYEVTGDYFELLGAQPAIGRFFHAADEHGQDSSPYLVLSDHLWRSAFDADRDVVGTTVRLDERPFTVIGVASARFHGTERFDWPDYWIPIVNRAGDSLQMRTRNTVTVIGRLKPGVTAEQATEDLNAVAGQLANEYPKTDRRVSLRLIRTGLFGDNGEAIRGFLFSVNVLALLLLLAACANLASLFAARTADRGRELALRMALGSGRLRLVRQLLTEAVLVSMMGGAAGLLGARLLLGALNRWQPSFSYSGQRLAASVDVDAGVYVAGLALTLGSGLLFGMVPAWRASQGSPLQVLKSGPVDEAHRRLAFRDLLLGAQIALCTLLVTASLVAVRSMVRALHGPIGIRPHGAMLAQMNFGPVEPQGGVALERAKAIIEAARSLPGVTAVGAARNTPLGGGPRDTPIYRPGATEFTADNVALATRAYPVSPGYLEAAGTRLLAGRDFSWHDTTETPSVAIVNATFARTMWGDTPAIGQTFYISERLTEVVGVAEDGKYQTLMESPQAAVYLPLPKVMGTEVIFVVRSRLATEESAGALRSMLSGIGPNVSLTLQSWPDALGQQLLPARVATMALGVIGFLAAMLAVTGIFGMAAYTVSRRRKELGIRTALGARGTHVMSAAVGRPAMLLGVGSALGLLLGVVASRLLGTIVYQAEPGNPAVLAGAALTMALLGIAGSAIPAWQALAVDPAKLLREE
jgi:predicted permease